MDPELTDLLARITELSDAELTDLLDRLRGEARDLAGNPTPENLALAEEIVAHIGTVRETLADREQQAIENERRAQEIIAAVADEAEAETDPSTEDGGEPAEAEAETEDAPEARVPVAAGGRPQAPVVRARARRPEAMTHTVASTTSGVEGMALTASSNVPNVPAGARLRDYDQIAEAFQQAYDHGIVGGKGDLKLSVMRAAARYAPERTLGRDPIANAAKLRRLGVQPERGLVAAGGIGAPTEIRYDLPSVGSSKARPARDALVRVGVERGGVKTLVPPSLTVTGTALSTGVDQITEAEDAAGSYTKPTTTVTHPTDRETKVYAVTKRLGFGEFDRRFFPELIEAWWDLLGVEHAREAEILLLNVLGSSPSIAVTAGQVLGAARDTLTALDRAIVVWRSSHRLDRNAVLDWLVPFWLIDMIRADLVRELPGSADDRMATADSMIEGWFRLRGVRPVQLLDGESGQMYAKQGAGALQGWISTVATYLYPAGSWLFLDGGTLDVGLVRDSTLIDDNSVEMFAETFEAAHFHGVESWKFTLDLCPDGTVAASKTISVCTTGS